jgi:transposase-like protein
MPSKVGTWRRDFAGLEQRRLEAARMFAHGATQAEVAHTFGVSAQAASVWYRRWHQGGGAALRGAGRAGRRPRLEAAELDAVEGAAQGPRSVRVRHRPVDAGSHRGGDRAADRRRLPSRARVAPAAPARLERAAARPPRGRARRGRDRPLARRGVAQDQGGALSRGAWLCFLDESGVSLRPPVRGTWAPRATPRSCGTVVTGSGRPWRDLLLPPRRVAGPAVLAQPARQLQRPDADRRLKQLRRFLRGAPRP